MDAWCSLKRSDVYAVFKTSIAGNNKSMFPFFDVAFEPRQGNSTKRFVWKNCFPNGNEWKFRSTFEADYQAIFRAIPFQVKGKFLPRNKSKNCFRGIRCNCWQNWGWYANLPVGRSICGIETSKRLSRERKATLRDFYDLCCDAAAFRVTVFYHLILDKLLEGCSRSMGF